MIRFFDSSPLSWCMYNIIPLTYAHPEHDISLKHSRV